MGLLIKSKFTEDEKFLFKCSTNMDSRAPLRVLPNAESIIFEKSINLF